MTDRVSTTSARVPDGWTSCKLGDLLFSIEAGKSFTCEPRSAGFAEWGIIKVSAMTWGTFDEAENKAVPANRSIDLRKEIRPGDILVSRSNTVALVGASVLVGTCRPKLLLSDKSLRLLYSRQLCARWLQASLAAPHMRGQLSARATGTSDSMRNISQGNVSSLRLLLPPRNEQERIADALDEILSDLDAGVEALKRAQAKLKLYRASVLKAVVTGDLTADWRAAHPDAEPATELLARILNERRRLWEAEQLRKYEGAGKHPPANWKSKYKEPVAPDQNLPELPKGWCWATVDQCSTSVTYGTSEKTSDDPDGVPVLRMGNLDVNGNLSFDSLKYLPKNHSEFPHLLLRPGDILFNRTNSAELVGKSAIYRGQRDICSFASYLIRIRAILEWPELIVVSINSVFGRSWVRSILNQTVGQANVNGTKLASFCFALPPDEEQKAIAQKLDEATSSIDHLQSDLAEKASALVALRQSALFHAFTGKLVPQESSDEPAHVLLERIAMERAERAAEARRQKLNKAARKVGSPANRLPEQQSKRSKPRSPARDAAKQIQEQAAAEA